MLRDKVGQQLTAFNHLQRKYTMFIWYSASYDVGFIYSNYHFTTFS